MSTPVEPSPSRARRRPRGVLVLAVFLVAQALLLMGLGGALVLARQDADVVLGLDDPTVPLVAGMILLAVGVVQVVLVVLLRRGSEVARSTIGAIAVIQAAGGVYATVALRDFQAAVLVPTAVSFGILWLLYGSIETQEFFTR